jgi:hypothetical protein
MGILIGDDPREILIPPAKKKSRKAQSPRSGAQRGTVRRINRSPRGRAAVENNR